MQGKACNLVNILKSELSFLERGGYWSELLPSWRAPLILEDSPTCLNYGRATDRSPCQQCLLMQLVPPERASEVIPCRHIPLNQQGETLDSLYRSSTQLEIETAVANWLRAQISELEKQSGKDFTTNSPASAKAKNA